MQGLRVVPPVLAPTTRGSRDRSGESVLQAVFDASSDAIVAVDGQLWVTSLNPAASALLGARGVVVHGLSCHDVLHCTDPSGESGRRPAPIHSVAPLRSAPCPRCPFREAMARRTRVSRRLRVADERGEEIALLGTFAPVPGPGGGAVAVLRPAYRDASGEAEATDSEVERSLAHQVRSTLALISGYSQTLLHLSLDDETRRRYLRQMTVAADWLAEIAEEILARPSAESTTELGDGPGGLADQARMREPIAE